MEEVDRWVDDGNLDGKGGRRVVIILGHFQVCTRVHTDDLMAWKENGYGMGKGCWIGRSLGVGGMDMK